MAHRKQHDTPSRARSALARATAHWRERKFDDAIRCFNEAVRLAPNDTSVLIDAGRALGTRYQMGRAVALFERALRRGSGRPDVQHAVGDSYRMLGRMVEAEACYRAACRLAAAPHSRFELARLCERRHALDEAADLIDSVLRADPNNFDAVLLAARIDRRRGETGQALAALQRLTTAAGPHRKVAAQAHGELCTLHDAAGKYDAAWEAIIRCKQILLTDSAAQWNLAQFVLGRCQRMISAAGADHFARWRSIPGGDVPRRVALLTGFPRSGTTLLEQALDAHPEVVSSEEKDVFSTEVLPQLGAARPADAPLEQVLDELHDDALRAARQFYFEAMESMLGEPIGQRLHLDKNPAMNLMIPPLKRVFPELKLVVALRDPRDVVVSCFLRYLPINPVSVCFLTLERTVMRYICDMEAWLKLRELINDWVEVRYEHAVADLPQEAARMLQNLGLAWHDGVLDYRNIRLRAPVQSPSYEEVARPLYATSIGRWRNYERHLEPVLRQLNPLVKALGYDT
jgi:tetratricopeptide (TPR) repeat protein